MSDFDEFDVRNRLSELDDRLDELRQLLLAVPEERAEFDERCKLAYAYHDSALEGVVLTYHELRAAMDRKVAGDATVMAGYQEIKNQLEALESVRARAEDVGEKRKRLEFTVEQFDDIHRLLYRNVNRKVPAGKRIDIPLHRTYFHEIVEPGIIATELTRVAALTTDSEFRAQHAVNQACLFHCEFMRAFPYADGSGKVGRLLMNAFLWRAGYLPAVIHASDRQAYYDALREGPEALRPLVIDAIEQAVDAGARHLKERLRARVTARQRRPL
jgi:Fic family protein